MTHDPRRRGALQSTLLTAAGTAIGTVLPGAASAAGPAESGHEPTDRKGGEVRSSDSASTRAAPAAPRQPAPQTFPSGFLWGTATSSYQVEGAHDEDGRGRSIWDGFSHTPDKVKNNDHGDVAADHYHRYRDDVQLMKSLGGRGYRFSIAWPRIFPEGSGQPNEKGLAFYDRLVDELLANGIEPWPTMYHWDLPQTLQDRYGGWQKRETAQAFADYAGFVAHRLSDRVRQFFTTNELSTFVELGHGSGIFAPGLKLGPKELNQVRHHAVLGHGLATQAIRARARPGTRVGPAENMSVGVPVYETAEHIEASRRATRELNAGYLTVMMEGRYTDAFLAAAGADAPTFTQQDLKDISEPVDFVGLNIYTLGRMVRAGHGPSGYEVVKPAASHPRLSTDWLAMVPEALYWGPHHTASLWKPRALYITENGCASADTVDDNGNINDTDRVMYLRAYLGQLLRATSDGVPVRGYFLWSLLDNFEWSSGYGTRFGIYHVDFKTQQRRPKLSAAFYREVIARNGLV